MTYFLIFLAVMVAAAAVLYVVGLNKPQAGVAVYDDVLGAPVANLPPVLLPGTPEPADVDKLRFSLGLRGYRMDQVDEVLDRLRDELAMKDARIAELESGRAAVPATEKEADDAGGEPSAAAPGTAVEDVADGATSGAGVTTGDVDAATDEADADPEFPAHPNTAA